LKPLLLEQGDQKPLYFPLSEPGISIYADFTLDHKFATAKDQILNDYSEIANDESDLDKHDLEADCFAWVPKVPVPLPQIQRDGCCAFEFGQSPSIRTILVSLKYRNGVTYYYFSEKKDEEIALAGKEKQKV
jgi:hypothetical protein